MALNDRNDTDVGNVGELEAPREAQDARILVGHGKAPYRFDANKGGSYFATTMDAQGNESTVWGVDIQRGLKDAGIEVGDTLSISKGESVPVHIRQADGATTAASRAQWNVEKLPPMSIEIKPAKSMDGSRIDIAESSDLRLRRREDGELRSNFKPAGTPAETAEQFRKFSAKLRGDAQRIRDTGDVGTADRMALQDEYEQLTRRSRADTIRLGVSKLPRDQQEFEATLSRTAREYDGLQAKMDILDDRYYSRHQKDAQGRSAARAAANNPEAAKKAPTSYRDSLPAEGQLEFDSLRAKVEVQAGVPVSEESFAVPHKTYIEQSRQLYAKQRAAKNATNAAAGIATATTTTSQMLTHAEDRKRPVPREVEGYSARRGHDGRTLEYVSRQSQSVDFRDSGRRVVVDKKSEYDPAVVKASITVANQKFERGFMLRGTSEIQALYAKEAVAQGIGKQIGNKDLQELIKSETAKRKALGADAYRAQMQIPGAQKTAASASAGALTDADFLSKEQIAAGEGQSRGQEQNLVPLKNHQKSAPLRVVEMSTPSSSQSQVRSR